jgi:4-amino-4-deoxy-L-arabinose transferase-like glycosyltransferase
MTGIIKREIHNLRWSHWLSFLGLAALFAALRWNNYDAPLIRDEGEYAYAAQLLLQGATPYQHAFIQKPPGVIYSYALADLFLPQHFWSVRLLAYLFVALATVLLGFIARWEFGKGFALPAMWLMTPMILMPGIDQYNVNTEMFMLLPLLATVAVCSYNRRHGHKNGHWFAAGFFAAVTLLYKYTALPIVAFVFLTWLFETYRSSRKITGVLKALTLFIAGGISASVLELGYFAMHGAIREFWECTITFNHYYVASGTFTPANLWSRLEMFWHAWWVLFLIPCAILLQPRRRVRFWVGIFLCSIVAIGGAGYLQYYIPMMPFWALLSAVGIRTLASKISSWKPKAAPYVANVFTAIAVLLVIRPDAPWMFMSRQQFSENKMLGVFPFIEAKLVGDKVAELSSSNDFVFVAGSEPEILVYAQRFSPTRFITSYALMIPTSVAARYQHEAIGDLEQNPPKIIVFPQSGYSWMRQSNTPPDFVNFLGSFLAQHYERVCGYVKSDAQNGYWATSLSLDEFRNCSLVVYKFKQ